MFARSVFGVVFGDFCSSALVPHLLGVPTPRGWIPFR